MTNSSMTWLSFRFNRPRVVPILCLILIVTVFHWRGIRPGHAFVPVDLANNNLPWRHGAYRPLQNALVSDPLYQFYPFLQQAVATVREEQRWPLWNPHIMLGHPTLGDPLSQPFFPLFLLLGLLFGAARGLTIGLWLLALMAALTTYGWLRAIGLSAAAAVAGGITYALSGTMVLWFETPFWVSTLAFLPAILWAHEHQNRFPRATLWPLTAVLYGLAVLGGQLQFMIAFTLFWGLYVLGHTIEYARQHQTLPRLPLLNFGKTIVFGTLLASIALLPAFELLAVSRRVVSGGASDALPFLQLITLLVPDFFGTPVGDKQFWGAINYAESTVYGGLVALLLASTAAIVDHRFRTVMMSTITLLWLYFIVGGPGVEIITQLPGIQYASLHRSTFLIPLLFAYLSAHAIDSLDRLQVPITIMSLVAVFLISGATFSQQAVSAVSWPQLWPAIGKSVLLIGATWAASWWLTASDRSPSYAKWAFVGLIIVDLFLFGSRFNPAGPIDQLMPPSPAIQRLQQLEPQRIIALQREDHVLIGPNISSLFGLSEAGGYSSLVIDRYHQLVALADPQLDIWWMNRDGNMVTFSDPSLRLMDLFQVSHLVSPVQLDSGIQAEFANNGCSHHSDEIEPSRPAQGIFEIRETAINRLDIRLANRRSTDVETTLHIRIWRRDRTGPLILVEERPLSFRPNAEETITVFFNPERDAPGQFYAWEVVTTDRAGIAVCYSNTGIPAISTYGSNWRALEDVEGLYIYERSAPMPRAYVVYAVEQHENPAEVATELLTGEQSIRHRAIVEQPVPLPETSNRSATPAQIIADETTRIVIRAQAAEEGLLVLGDQFYPGWRATIDGNPTEVIRANSIFRAVVLPPGAHEVIFEFRPQSLRWGLIGSATALLILIFAVVAPFLGNNRGDDR